LGEMTNLYNTTFSKPGIQFFEGVEGVSAIYQDILRHNTNFYFVRCPHEPTYANKLQPTVQHFIKKRIAQGIHVTAITPQDAFVADTQNAELAKKDAKNLLTRIPVSLTQYNAPVEIDVYGDRVALISFGIELIGTIIESPQIAQAFRQLFLLIQHTTNTTHPARKTQTHAPKHAE
jgi:hypothetical protein